MSKTTLLKEVEYIDGVQEFLEEGYVTELLGKSESTFELSGVPVEGTIRFSGDTSLFNKHIGDMMRFLVVDDSAFSRRKIADFISHVGGTVIGEASDGLEAVEQYSKLLPEFVTMDIEMPKINGIEASKEILKINKDAKIILITSSVDKKEILIALKTGVKQVMQKPITIEEFTKIVNELR